jgi:hypothetical protein
LNGSGEGNPLGVGIVIVYNKMNEIFSGEMKNKLCQVDIRYREARIVPYSKLRIACEKNGSLNELGDKYGKYKSGFDKVMDDMRENKAVKILDKDPLGGRAPKLVQVTYAMDDYILPLRGLGGG